DAFSTPRDSIPQGFNARTKVHEYGGASYWVHGDTVFFSNFSDQRLYRVDADGEPAAITPDTQGRYRYADGVVTADGATIVCVRERHEGETSADVVNELVAMPTDGSAEPRIVAGGRDFFAGPRLSPDGSRITWFTW